MYDGMKIYKGIVSSSSSSTGLVYVKIPALLGPSESVSVSKVNITQSGGSWVVPDEGKQVIVAIDDELLSNVYLISFAL